MLSYQYPHDPSMVYSAVGTVKAGTVNESPKLPANSVQALVYDILERCRKARECDLPYTNSEHNFTAPTSKD